MGQREVVLERSGSVARVMAERIAAGPRRASFAIRSDDHKRRLAAFRGQRRAEPQ